MQTNRLTSTLADHWLDIVIISLSLIYSYVIWLPTRYLPFHWDAAGFIASATQNLIDTNFSPLIAVGSDFVHPPLLPLIFALILSYIPQEIPLYGLHLVMYLSLPLLLIASYYVIKRAFSPLLGILTLTCLAVTPVVLAEYGNLYIDLPAAALGMTALALWYHRHHFTAQIPFLLGVFIKASILLLIPAYFIYPIKSKRYWFLTIPLIGFGIWILYHYSHTGWLFTRPGRQVATPDTLPELIRSFSFVLQVMFIHQGRWMLSLIALIFTLTAIVKGSFSVIWSNKYLRVFGITIAISVIAYTISAELAQRYILYLYPLIYASLLFIIYQSLASINIKYQYLGTIIITSIVGLVMASYAKPANIPTQEYNFRPPADLGYLDMIQIHRQAAAYIQVAEPDAKIYGGFPENIYVSNPIAGYVFKNIETHLCTDYTYDESKTQIIYFHAYSPSQVSCRQLLDQYPLKPIQRFESADKWLELYEVDHASMSAIRDAAN